MLGNGIQVLMRLFLGPDIFMASSSNRSLHLRLINLKVPWPVWSQNLFRTFERLEVVERARGSCVLCQTVRYLKLQLFISCIILCNHPSMHVYVHIYVLHECRGTSDIGV